MSRHTLVPSLAALLLAAGPALAAPDEAVGQGPEAAASDAAAASAELQAALDTWWLAAADYYLGDTVYEVQPRVYDDGVCAVSLGSGHAVPVWSGRLPVQPRIVGFVFLGEGALALSFPERADAWRFGNHQALHGSALSGATLDAIAGQQQPYESGVDRAVVISADPAVRDLLAGLEPVKAGVRISTGSDGIDEEYVVTEGRVPAGLKTTAGELLHRRLRHLREVGLDPIVSLRYDRLLMEEVGVPAGQQRTWWSLRVDDPLYVANAPGRSLVGNDQDRWLGCLDDPGDFHGTGFETLAFAHGPDPQGRVTHFERLSGLPWIGDTGGDAGGDTAGDTAPEGRLQPRAATADVRLEPVDRGLHHRLHIEADLSFEVSGGPLRHALLSLPDASEPLHVREVSLQSTERTLATVNLGAGLVRTVPGGAADRDTEQAGATAVNHGGLPDSTALSGVDSEAGAPGDFVMKQADRLRDTTLVLFEEPLAEGETVDLRLSVLTRHASARNPDTGNHGMATAPLPYLPQVRPLRPDEAWSFETTVRTPSAGLRVRALAASGQTVDLSDDGREQVLTVRGEGFRQPTVATGRWWVQADPAAAGLPAVRVHVQPDSRRKLGELAPEVRRQALWLQGFLPDDALPAELDIIELTSIHPRVALQQQARVDELGGMLALQRTAVLHRGRAILPGQRSDFGGLGSEGFTPFTPAWEQTDGDAAADGMELEWVIIEALGPDDYTEVTATSARAVQNTYEIAAEDADLIPDRTDMADAGALRRSDPHLAQRQLARQVAWQVLGEARDVASPRDRWLPLALSDAYAAFYLRSVYGIEDYNATVGWWRQTIEEGDPHARWLSPTVRDRRFLSQTGATALSDTDERVRANAGAYVLGEMLRFRLGDAAFFATIEDLVASGEPLSVAALEARLGPAHADFFDYWVHGGFVPALSLELDRAALETEGRLEGCVKSDLPYGSFEVPLVILSTDEAPRLELVTVNDGLAEVDLALTGSASQVMLDPTGGVLARERRVRLVDSPVCEEVAAQAAR